MDQIPENNQTVEQEESTIFSAPTQHNDRNVKTGGGWKKILAAFIAVALLAGGTFAIIKLIPVLDDGSATSSNTLMAVQLESDDIESVTVKYGNSTLKLFSTIEENSSTTSSSDNSTSVIWELEGYDKNVIDATTVSQTATDVASITALREMNNASADYGFDTPKATAVVTCRGDVKDYTITVGDTSPDGSGVYLKLSNKETVYLVEEDEISCLYEGALYYVANISLGGIAKIDGISNYFTNDAVSDFDKITLSGKNFKEPLVIEKTKDKSIVSDYVKYAVVSPLNRPADNVSEILSSLGGGVNTVGAYSFDKSDASLKKFGLDNPYLIATIQIGEFKREYKFAKVDDTHTAVIADNDPLIRKVTNASISYIDSIPTDYYYKAMLLEGIYDLSSYAVEKGNEKYVFNIKYTPEDEEKNIKEKFDISVNSKEIKAETFQDYYTMMLGIISVDYNTKKISGNYETVVTLKHSNGSDDTVLGFKKYSEQRYQYYLNGVAMGQITSGDYNKIMDYAKNVASGEELNAN